MNHIYKNYNINFKYRERIYKLFEKEGVEKIYKDSEIIEGGKSKLNYIYFIKSGLVRQYFIDLEGKEKTLLILKSGDIFGEVTMIQGDADMVISQADLDCVVNKIEKEKFNKILEDNPTINKEIMIMLSSKFRILMFQLYDYSFFDMKIKLYNLLCRLSIQHGKDTEDGRLIEMNLTHEKLAAMTGSTRSTITKLINELEEEGYIKRKKNFIIVKLDKYIY